MAFDFEALVGHLYVVSGRTISAPPPGTLVEVAPKTAARGRELETFFTMVLPSGDAAAPAAFYEQMAKRAAEDYFSQTGSVTAALRNVFTTLNQRLVEHNRSGRRPYEANMLCAVLHGDDLIVGRVGSGVSAVQLANETQTFPENLNDDDAVFKPPMGIHPVPDVRMARYTIMTGSRLVLGDSNMAEIPLERLRFALRAKDIAETLAIVRQEILTQISVIAVEFVPPDAPASLPVREAESTLELTAPKTSTSEQKKAEPPARRSQSSRRLAEATEGVQAQAKRGAGSLALALASVLSALNRLLDLFLPPPSKDGRKWLSTPLASGIVVLVPVVMVVLVVVMWVGGTGKSEFEQCLKEAYDRRDLARSIPTNNVTDTLNAWTLVLDQVETCNTLREGDIGLTNLRTEGQEIIDRLSMVERREATLVAALRDATLRRIMLQGSDLYALDEANGGLVYRIALSGDGLSAASAPQPIPAMRRGALVDQFSIGELIDIAFGQRENKIVTVDRDGVVVKCEPRFITTCEPQRLVGTENWGNPVAITVWEENLYILDPGANQIWRYVPSGGVYASAPSEYFTGQGRPPLSTAVDFAIDDNGWVYILRADGALGLYFQGEAQDFGWAGFRENPTSAVSLFLNKNPIFPGLFVANRANRTIYETSLSGTFNASYRVFDENKFALLIDVTADSSQQLIYAASGNSIFVIRK